MAAKNEINPGKPDASSGAGSITSMVERITGDEESVRTNGAGRGRLLDDLHAVPNAQVRAIFEAVCKADQAKGKPPVVDISNGTLIITDVFKNVAPGTPAANTDTTGGATAGPGAQPDSSTLGQLKDLWHHASWWEKPVAVATAYQSAKLGNTVLEAIVDKAMEAKSGADKQHETVLQTQRRYLQEEIKAHEAHVGQRSVLQTIVGHLTSKFWNSDYQTLDALKKAEKATDEVEVVDLIKADQRAMKKGDSVAAMAGDVVKMVPLFMTGEKATMAYAGLSALDEAKVGDSLAGEVVDLGIGATKGYATKALLNKVGTYDVGLPVKAAVVTVGARAIDSTLSRQTYVNSSTGNVDLMGGAANIVRDTSQALGTAALASGVAYGVMKMGSLSDVVANNGLYSTVVTAGVMGAALGAADEVAKERANDEDFSLTDVLGRSILQGGLDGIASIPGRNATRTV